MDTLASPRQTVGAEVLGLYHSALRASRAIMTDVIPTLLMLDRDELAQRLAQVCHTIPRVVAQWSTTDQGQSQEPSQRLTDAIADAYDAVAYLCCCRDLLPDVPDQKRCQDLIHAYTRIGQSLFVLARARCDPTEQERRIETNGGTRVGLDMGNGNHGGAS